MRRSVLTALVLLASRSHAQSRATCLFNEHFDGPAIPPGWGIAPGLVERLDGNGNGTGEFTEPWQVGDASVANAAGYFPVPDAPHGNTFAMANDDAPPCDCAMGDVSLSSPAIDLSSTTAPAMSFRIFHDGRPFNGRAWVEASTDGTAWTTLEEVPRVLNAWQDRVVDLSAFVGSAVQVRFRYDDAGAWASGLAVDDVCVFARTANDLAFTGAWVGDPTTSPFNTSVRSLGYSRLPLEQGSPLVTAVRIRNNGTSAATGVTLEGSISVDGGTPLTSSAIVIDTLAPLADSLVIWNSGWTSTEAGEVTIALAVGAAAIDEDLSDNTTQLGFTITSTTEGNNAMALDNDLAESLVGLDGGFSTGCRYEMVGSGSVMRGISTRFGAGTEPGTSMRALVLDPNLNLLAISSAHIITAEDLALSFSGGTVYIPLDSGFAIDGAQDLLALVRFDPDSGAMRIAAGGAVPLGSAFLVEADGLTISYPESAPIVRIHLSDPVTGLSTTGASAPQPWLFPNPADDHAWIRVAGDLPRSAGIEVFDPLGRLVRHVPIVPAQGSTYALDVSGLPSGSYWIRLVGAKAAIAPVPLLIQH